MEGLEELITARKWTNGSTLVRLAYPKLLPSLSHASPTPLSSPPEALLTPLSSLLLDPRFILIVLVVLCVLCAFSAWELVGGVLWDPKTPKSNKKLSQPDNSHKSKNRFQTDRLRTCTTFPTQPTKKTKT